MFPRWRQRIGQAGAFAGGPVPGERVPFGHRLKGTGHHLILFGKTPLRLDYQLEPWVDWL
jgi:hypothetical protein